MRIIVDTNIVFSAILNSNGLIGDVLFNSNQQFDFYSAEYLIDEISKYKEKLLALTNMSEDKMDVAVNQILKNIGLISPDAISNSYWKAAYELASGVDENDTPFLATAISLDASIWTGDKKSIKGLRLKGFQSIYSTTDLVELRKEAY